MQLTVVQPCRLGRTLTGSARSSRTRVLAHSMDQHHRQVPLPNAVWYLDELRDKWVNVQGADFVICRAESERASSGLPRPKSRAAGVATGSSGVPAPVSPADLIYQAVRMHPGQTALLLPAETGPADSSDIIGDVLEVEAEPVSAITSIIPFGNQLDTEEAKESEDFESFAFESQDKNDPDNIYLTDSMSPRRTKLLGFTCNCCGARNYSRINPLSYSDGTLAVQCKKCERWHKITDHLNLFHQMKGHVYPKRDRVTMEDIPESLRPPLHPFYWQDQDLEGGSSSSMGSSMGDPELN